MNKHDNDFMERLRNHDANGFCGSLVIGCFGVTAIVLIFFFIFNLFN